MSLRDAALKYGIGDSSVRKWIAKYNTGGFAALLPNHAKKHYSNPSFTTAGKWGLEYNDCSTIRGSETGGTTIMTKGRKTTYEERIEIISFCIEKIRITS